MLCWEDLFKCLFKKKNCLEYDYLYMNMFLFLSCSPLYTSNNNTCTNSRWVMLWVMECIVAISLNGNVNTMFCVHVLLECWQLNTLCSISILIDFKMFKECLIHHLTDDICIYITISVISSTKVFNSFPPTDGFGLFIVPGVYRESTQMNIFSFTIMVISKLLIKDKQ